MNDGKLALLIFRREETMSELGIWMATVFTGVFGAVIGFVIITAAAFFLALPYILFTRKSEKPQEDRNTYSDKYV